MAGVFSNFGNDESAGRITDDVEVSLSEDCLSWTMMKKAFRVVS
jgi:hypothetical protein